MVEPVLALSAVVKVLADGALVAQAANRILTAAIASDAKV